METPNAAEAKARTAAEIEAMVTEARAAGFSAAAEIVDLCDLAGMPAKATGFITARKPVVEVRGELLKAKVEAEKAALGGKDLDTGVMPGQAAKGADAGAQGKAAPWGDILAKLGIRRKQQS